MEETTDRFIRKIDQWAGLSDGDKAALLALTTNSVPFARGAHLVREGDEPQNTLLLLSGWAARYKMLPNGRRLITAILLPGDLCDLHIFILARMDHSICSLSSGRVVKIPRAELQTLFDERPGVARAFWWSSMVDEAVQREWLVNLGGRDALGRVAHLLCELGWRADNIGGVEDGWFPLPLTQVDLADALGLTQVHVNRMIQQLRQDGLVVTRRGSICFPDIERLRQLAGFDPAYLHDRTIVQAPDEPTAMREV